MDPVWSKVAAPTPNWVISSIKIAPLTHFLVQNLENPQIWPGSEILGPKMLKIMKNKNFQTCPEIIPTHLLRILGALQHLKTCFSYYFRSLTSHPIRDQDTKNDDATSKNINFQICLEIISTHPRRILCELPTSKKDFWHVSISLHPIESTAGHTLLVGRCP